MCRKGLSCPRCRSELIDSAWVVIVPGQKCIKKNHSVFIVIILSSLCHLCHHFGITLSSLNVLLNCSDADSENRKATTTHDNILATVMQNISPAAAVSLPAINTIRRNIHAALKERH